MQPSNLFENMIWYKKNIESDLSRQLLRHFILKV